jgi:hypothetical protein
MVVKSKETDIDGRLQQLETKVNGLERRKDKYKLRLRKTERMLVPQKELLTHIRALQLQLDAIRRRNT